MPLDERALEHQRLKFRARDDGVEMVNLGDHPARLRRVRRRILKILADAVFELFGLADIDDCAGLILHEVDAGLVWERKRFVL